MKYLQIDTVEKISEELLGDVCNPHTDLYHSSHRGLGNPVWRKCYQETFSEIALGHVKSTRTIKLLFSLIRIPTLF